MQLLSTVILSWDTMCLRDFTSLFLFGNSYPSTSFVIAFEAESLALSEAI